MSNSDENGTPTITRVEKTQVPKNPQKVAAGKKLAAISKEAKEKKAQERFIAEQNMERDTEHPPEESADENPNSFLILTGVVVGLTGLYFAYAKVKSLKSDKKEELPNEPEKAKPKPQLDSFDD